MRVRSFIRDWGGFVLVAVLAVVVAASILSGSSDGSEPAVNGSVFAHVEGGGPQMFLRQWAVRNGSGLSAPVAFDSSYSWSGVVDAIVTREDPTMGFVSLSAVPGMLDENKDIRLLPYRYVDPGYVFNIAVRNDSVVYHPVQLRGKEVGAGYGLFGSMMTLTALDMRFGVNTSTMDVVSMPFSLIPRLLMSESIDAGVATVSGRPGFRSVFDPEPVFERRFNATPFFTVFAVNDPGSCDTAREVVSQYRDAAVDASNNVSSVIRAYKKLTGMNRSAMFRQNAASIMEEGTVASIGEGDIAATDAMWAYAYRNGFRGMRRNVRELFDRYSCG